MSNLGPQNSPLKPMPNCPIPFEAQCAHRRLFTHLDCFRVDHLRTEQIIGWDDWRNGQRTGGHWLAKTPELSYHCLLTIKIIGGCPKPRLISMRKMKRESHAGSLKRQGRRVIEREPDGRIATSRRAKVSVGR